MSFLPRNSFRAEVQQGTLSEVKIKEEYQVTLRTSVIVRRARASGTIVEAFMGVLRELFPMSAGTPVRIDTAV